MNTLKTVAANIFDLEKDRAPLEEITARIYSGGTLKGTNMCILILAIFIASIGLNMNSTAVIIGAMLISPLMGVIMSLGYGMATYDSAYVRESFLKLVFQVSLSVLTSAVYFTLSPIDTASTELLARTEPNIWDVLIAIFGGLAGIIGSTRIEKSNVIPGVAIATALMPPLCTAGYGLATYSPKFFFGALYLFFINSFFICLTTFIVLKFIKIPAKTYVSEQVFRRQRWLLSLLGVLIILPSMYMAYQSIRNNLEHAQVKAYIESNFQQGNPQVVAFHLNPQEKKLDLTLIGRTVTDEEQAELEKKLQTYSHFADWNLHIIQNDLSGTVRAEDVQNLINTQWNAAGGASLAKAQEDLRKYKELSMRYSPAYQRFEADQKLLASIREKAPILFPSFTGVEGATVATENKDGQIIPTGFLAVITCKSPLTADEQTRLQKWLNAEAELPVSFILRITPETD